MVITFWLITRIYFLAGELWPRKERRQAYTTSCFPWCPLPRSVYPSTCLRVNGPVLVQLAWHDMEIEHLIKTPHNLSRRTEITEKCVVCWHRWQGSSRRPSVGFVVHGCGSLLGAHMSLFSLMRGSEALQWMLAENKCFIYVVCGSCVTRSLIEANVKVWIYDVASSPHYPMIEGWGQGLPLRSHGVFFHVFITKIDPFQQSESTALQPLLNR